MINKLIKGDNIEIMKSIDENYVDLIITSPPYDDLRDYEKKINWNFEIFKEVEITCPVIFATAYDQYAIQAFRVNSVDYLLKPIVPDDLKKAVEKHREKISAPDRSISYKTLLENLNPEPRKIVLHTFEGMHVVETADIIRCQSDDCYTNFYLNSGKRIIVSKTLKEIEEQLTGKDFIRPHKSHLINLQYIKTVVRNDGGYIIMKDGTEIPISRRKKEMVMDIINKL